MSVFVGDCRDGMASLEAESVQTVVTSPPYFGLRDYGVSGQLGLEPAPDCLGWATGDPCGVCFICQLVDVFRHVRRVLRKDGTAWVNLGDSYAGSGRGGHPGTGTTLQGSPDHQDLARHAAQVSASQRLRCPPAKGARGVSSTLNPSAKRHQGVKSGTWTPAPRGWKQKDLLLMPARMALALQADGWYVRQDVVWNKPNPMPESVGDRCTKSHEYVFLLSRSERYYFDQAAILEPCSPNTHARMAQNLEGQAGSTRANGGTRADRPFKPVATRRPDLGGRGEKGCPNGAGRKLHPGTKSNASFDAAMRDVVGARNKRSVWTIPTESFKGAHFATFPQALVEPCILAGSRPGDLVLDPFLGSGTTAVVAERLARRWFGCELNPEYAELARGRIAGTAPGLALA